MARFYIMRFQDEEALNNAEKPLQSIPMTQTITRSWPGLIFSGSPDAAIPFCERMRRIDPPACSDTLGGAASERLLKEDARGNTVFRKGDGG